MRRHVALLAFAALAATPACGGDEPGATVDTTSTSTTTTTTEAPIGTEASPACEAAVQHFIDTFGDYLDKVEEAPERAGEVTTNPTMRELGQEFGANCGPDESGPAFSRQMLYLAEERERRDVVGAAGIYGALNTLCLLDLYTLTPDAQAVCDNLQP